MGLERFIEAQEQDYETALSEIKSGRKRSHWMWYIFPQLAAQGRSDIAKHYGIADLPEAEAYHADRILGRRLVEISNALLTIASSNATQVMGSPDDLKLRSSMTLFSMVKDADPVFQAVLDKYYGGALDHATVELLR